VTSGHVEEPLREGWGWPMLSKKAHYFDGSTSLCRRWLYMAELKPDEFRGPDDCKACCKLLDKRKAKATP
jgi:hypothetical protein